MKNQRTILILTGLTTGILMVLFVVDFVLPRKQHLRSNLTGGRTPLFWRNTPLSEKRNRIDKLEEMSNKLDMVVWKLDMVMNAIEVLGSKKSEERRSGSVEEKQDVVEKPEQPQKSFLTPFEKLRPSKRHEKNQGDDPNRIHVIHLEGSYPLQTILDTNFNGGSLRNEGRKRHRKNLGMSRELEHLHKHRHEVPMKRLGEVTVDDERKNEGASSGFERLIGSLINESLEQMSRTGDVPVEVPLEISPEEDKKNGSGEYSVGHPEIMKSAMGSLE